jgi:hypothetical protein
MGYVRMPKHHIKPPYRIFGLQLGYGCHFEYLASSYVNELEKQLFGFD